MKRPELLALRQIIAAKTREQKAQGGYSADAPTLQLLLETQLAVLDHLLERAKLHQRSPPQTSSSSLNSASISSRLNGLTIHKW